jgi:alkylhydroperoxidase/carboxymuconolactone decarboxylase family protein YurZ
MITHLAFDAGWHTARTAVGIAREVFEEPAQVSANADP